MARKDEQSSYSEKIAKLFDDVLFGDGGSDDKKLKRLFGYCDKAEQTVGEDEAKTVENILVGILSQSKYNE